MYKINDKKFHCAIDISQDIFNDNWKLKILWHLLSGEKRYKELNAEVTNITQRTLTAKLRDLEEKKLIRRESFAEIPPRVVYSLTPTGEKLRPILNAMYDWGVDYVQDHGEFTEKKDEPNFA